MLLRSTHEGGEHLKNSKANAMNLIATMIKDRDLVRTRCETPTQPRRQTEDIFVVHGHDEAMKQSVCRVLERLGLRPIVLHEKPNLGRTIIEKFTDHAAVGFAVVLLSPD